MRTFVIGDIHGAYKAFLNCLKQANFDLHKDQLICLGDVCDRGPDVSKAISHLLQIKNLIYILGNHDIWAIKWAESGKIPDGWMFQGGNETIKSYPDGLPASHLNLLRNAHNYYINKGRLFVHGGIRVDQAIEDQKKEVFLWDRSLVSEAMQRRADDNISPITEFKEIYVGHTPTHNFGSEFPINACEVWLMDTGAGWDKRLSLMNIDTKEIFQSEVNEALFS